MTPGLLTDIPENIQILVQYMDYADEFEDKVRGEDIIGRQHAIMYFGVANRAYMHTQVHRTTKRKKSILVLNMKYEHCPCLLIFKTVIQVYDDVCIWLNTIPN